MPQPLPRTLLSIIYHGTIQIFQDEMHSNPTVAFQRFGITDATSKKVCLAVDEISGPLRRNPNHDPTRDKFEIASNALFDRLKTVLDEENAQGPSTQPDQPKEGSNGPDVRLLTSLYLVQYSKEFRDGPAPLPNLDPPPADQAERTRLQSAWDEYKKARRAGAVPPAPATEVLCKRAATEFVQDVWEFIW